MQPPYSRALRSDEETRKKALEELCPRVARGAMYERVCLDPSRGPERVTWKLVATRAQWNSEGTFGLSTQWIEYVPPPTAPEFFACGKCGRHFHVVPFTCCGLSWRMPVDSEPYESSLARSSQK